MRRTAIALAKRNQPKQQSEKRKIARSRTHMKTGILNLLKGTFLVQEGASKNWRFILFVFFLAGLMITASHKVDQKVVQIAKASNELQAVRSEFVSVREQVMHKRMETQLANRLQMQGIFPPEKAAIKIIVQADE